MQYLDGRIASGRLDANNDAHAFWTAGDAAAQGSLSRGLVWALGIAVSFWVMVAALAWAL